MPANGKVKIVIPGDDPVQIAGSPELKRLEPYGETILYTDHPSTMEEKINRVKDAEIIVNSRNTVTWSENDFSLLPKLKMITTCSIGTDAYDLKAAKARGIIIMQPAGPHRAGGGGAHVRAHVRRGQTPRLFYGQHQRRRVAPHRQYHAPGKDPGYCRGGGHRGGRWPAWPRPSAWRSSPGPSTHPPSGLKNWA